MKKIVSNVVANEMREAVLNCNKSEFGNLTVCKDIVAASVVLNSGTVDKKSARGKQSAKYGCFNNPSGVPFLCFMQKASRNKVVIYGMETGKTDIVDASVVSIKHKNLNTFSIKGVRYQLKDVVNGLPRFEVRNGTSKTKAINLQEFDL